MSHNEMAEPEKFELSSIVTKNSRTGITSNRRLLVIKGGKLYYYSNIPKFFDGTQIPIKGNNIKALEVAHQLPKCSIDIINIKNINEFDLNSPFFSIEFNTKHMMEKEDIRNSAMNMDYNFTPRQNSQDVTWQFTCDNQFVKKRWVSALKMLKEYYKQEQIKIQKFMQSIDANSHHPHEDFKSSSFSSRSSIKLPVPWRESNFSRRSYNPDKGFQFNGSPNNTIKIQDVVSLKHGKSDRSLKSAENPQLPPPSPPQDNSPNASFEMIVHETINREPMSKQQANIIKIEDVFKRSISEQNKAAQRKISKSRYSIRSSASGQMPVPTPIQEVSQQTSVMQTPYKEDKIDVVSYSDSDSYQDRRLTFEKVEGKQTSSIPPKMKKSFQVSQTLSIQVVGLSPIQERNSFNTSKSHEHDFTPTNININVKEPQVPMEGSIIKSTKSSKLEESIKEEAVEDDDDQNYRFEYLWGQSCRNNCTFQQKLSTQKQLLREMLTFKDRAVESISSWLESKVRGQNRYSIIEESPKYMVIEVGKMILKIANISTQRISINGSTKIFYNQDAIKNLKRQFKIHQNLFKNISKQIKSQPNFKLRLPLSVYLEYKGVCCIATRDYSLSNYVSIVEQSYHQEINFLLGEGYKPEWFAFKPIGKYLSFQLKPKSKYFGTDDESVKQYLRKIVLLGRKQKNHNLVFDPPINKTFLEIAQKQNASTSIQSLQRYVKGLKLAKQLPGPCPKQQIIEALSYCIFCKQLRKVYRSAQGQIGQTHFFNLIFKKDLSILDLLSQSDCHVPTKANAQLFSFIEHYFGIVLEIDEKVYQQYVKEGGASQKKDVFVSSVAKPIVRQYQLQGFQIIQAFSKLDYYLENRHPLARAALDKKKQVFALHEHLSQAQQLELLYNEASYLYFQSDYTGCIKKCKQYESMAPPKSTVLFPLYLLMMKAYSEFSESDFTAVFKKSVVLIQLNYGKQNSSLINLNSLAAFYYQKLMNVSNNKNNNILQNSIRLMKQAQHLCLGFFSNSSKQYLDIVLDSSRLYSKYDLNVAVAYLEEAKKVCQTNPTLFNAENLISILSFECSLFIKRGMYSQAEASLNHALSLVDTRIPLKTKIHLFRLQHEVGFYIEKFQACEEAIEKLWQLGTYQKLEALEMAYRLAFKETGITQAEVLGSESVDISFDSHERGLIDLQQLKQQYDNLVDMLATSIQNSNHKILQLVYWLIHNGRRSSLNVSYT